MSLHNRVSPGTGNLLMEQRREKSSKPLPESKTQEKQRRRRKYVSQYPEDSEVIAGRPPLSPPPLLATPELRPKESMAELLYDEGWVSSSKTNKSTQFGQGPCLFGARQVPLRQYPIGRVNQKGQRTGDYWAHTSHTLFSPSDLLNRKNPNPSYIEGPEKMTDFVVSIFYTNYPN